MRLVSLPFLSLPDPAVIGEGILDPLGLSVIGDRLADWILPGLTARMSRSRFLTAMAVSAVVCDGLEEEIAADGVTPAHILFEWLLVESFARQANDWEVLRTPGIDKARAVRDAEIHMSARNYLKTPEVFGFHGVYKRLARHLGIVDDELRLGDSGQALLKIWEEEQRIEGFLDSSELPLSSTNIRGLLRSAVEDGLEAGYADRSPTWQGWFLLTQHLAPGKVGRREAGLIRELLLDPRGDTRGEIFQLIEQSGNLQVADSGSEAALVSHLLPQAGEELARRFNAIIAYEKFCALIEDSFDILRYLSSQAGARALKQSEFAATPEVKRIAGELNENLEMARKALDGAPRQAIEQFSELARSFERVDGAEDLYDALLSRHSDVQRAKPPEGKREWFERSADDSLFVRAPYRLDEPVAARDWWARPYRLYTVASFCHDLKGETKKWL
jgi:hypothetical protein